MLLHIVTSSNWPTVKRRPGLAITTPSVGQSGPGGSTTVQPLLLQIMLAAAAAGHTVGVSEIAGGVHGTHVAHYSGHAVDFSTFMGNR